VAQIAFKIAIYSLMLNVAVAIMLALVPSMVGNIGGLSYDSSMNNDYVSGLNGSISTSATAESSTSLRDIFLDSIVVSTLIKIVTTITSSLYAFPNMLQTLFGPYMGSAGDVIFPLLYTVITIAYLIGVIGLFSGRDITE